MTISSVSCIPIKPQVSFKSDSQDNAQDNIQENQQNRFKEFKNYYQTISHYKINLNDIKEPVEIAETVLLATIIPYASAKCLSYEVLSAKTARNFCHSMENHLKSAANKTRDFASKLTKQNSTGIISGVKKYTGLLIGKVENLGRKFYKTIAYYGLPDDINPQEKSVKAATNIIAAGVVTKMLPYICTKDSDGDGVIDIKQHKHSLLSLIGPSI